MKNKIVSILAVLVALAVLPGIASAQSCNVNLRVLKIDVAMMDLNPKVPRCVAIGDVFKIKIVPPNSPVNPGIGGIRVHEKLDDGLEIRGTNDPNQDMIIVSVEGTAVPGSDHGFIIKVDDIGYLDPEVRVVTPMMFHNNQLSDINNLIIGEFGVGLEAVQNLVEEYGLPKDAVRTE